LQVYAHRGASLSHPENTMAAFRTALEEGATGIETDLRLTRDGVIVLVHDPDLGRVAGVPLRVSELTLNDLEAVRVGGSHPVPTLDEFWRLAEGRVRVNLEVKDPRVAPALVRFLRAKESGALVTSSHWSVIDGVREALPHLPVGPVLRHLGPRELARVRDHGYGAVSLSADSFSEQTLRFCHAEGLALLLWVVNEPERVLHFERLGVDGVFTDCPRPVALALSERGATGETLVP
jgi:glycerophosphoryl diester phosphodiesterase